MNVHTEAERPAKSLPLGAAPAANLNLAHHPRRGIYELDLLLADFLTKKVAWEVSVAPDVDLETDCPEYEAAQEAVERLVCYRCRSLAEVQKKARMIRDNWWLSDEVADNLDDFLSSLLPTDEVAS